MLGLSLCPWALPVYEQGAIRYAFTEARLPDARGERRLVETALQECSLLSSATGHSTTIIVAPDASPDDFRVFLDACGEVESALAEAGLDAAFQAVAFHPLFCFAGEPADDPGNFVNRSPHPMLHLLRQDDVTAALVAHEERGDDVASSNQQRLQALGSQKLRELLVSVNEAAEEDREHAEELVLDQHRLGEDRRSSLHLYAARGGWSSDPVFAAQRQRRREQQLYFRWDTKRLTGTGTGTSTGTGHRGI